MWSIFPPQKKLLQLRDRMEFSAPWRPISNTPLTQSIKVCRNKIHFYSNNTDPSDWHIVISVFLKKVDILLKDWRILWSCISLCLICLTNLDLREGLKIRLIHSNSLKIEMTYHNMPWHLNISGGVDVEGNRACQYLYPGISNETSSQASKLRLFKTTSDSLNQVD